MVQLGIDSIFVMVLIESNINMKYIMYMYSAFNFEFTMYENFPCFFRLWQETEEIITKTRLNR